MYFKIGPKEKDENFSWIIIKNPESKFERKISDNENRFVYGQFDKLGHFYEGFIKNDNLKFLETVRNLNLSNYLHPQLSSVCPHNLKGFDLMFKSVLRGNKGKDNPISSEDYFKKKMFYCFIGPFPYEMNGLVFEVFEEYNFKTNKIIDNIAEMSFMLELENIEPITTTEFFQKIYLLSTFLTQRYSLTRIEESQILKFAELCKDWLDESSRFRNRIINILSKRHKGFIKAFESQVIQETKEKSKDDLVKEFEDRIERVGLHEKRHNLILDIIEQVSPNTVVDLACSEGKLLKKIFEKSNNNDVSILGIDSNPNKIRGLKNKLPKKLKLENTNVLFPLINDKKFINPDFLILCEIIEHFNYEDRLKLMDNIVNLFAPEYFILTTPNYELNENYGLFPGQYRHRDHKIEFTKEEFHNEVYSYLERFYDLENFDIGEGSTICLFGKRKRFHKPDEKYFYNLQRFYSPHYIELTDYEIRKKEFTTGFSSLSFIKNWRHIFYLAPTMSPVDYNDQFSSYLEHPVSCFNYYKERGIETLIEEEKYMGSRGYILFFKNPDYAKLCGFEKPIVINSRSGYTFFEGDDSYYLDKLWNELNSVIDSEFIILDCEIMPWSYKAKGLINHEFRVSGECSYLHRKYTGDPLIKNSKEFLNTLNHYSMDSEIEIRPFHILAEGKIKISNKGKLFFSDYTIGCMLDHLTHMKKISSYFNNTKYFKPCIYDTVNLNDKVSMEKSVERWEDFCKNKNGEGFVYKPFNFMNFTNSMYLLQPALKVRGKKYLQLVYGIDYLEKEYFEKVTKRSIKKKRILSIQEQLMSLRILQCFLKRNEPELIKSIAGFLGMENVNMKNIDATL